MARAAASQLPAARDPAPRPRITFKEFLRWDGENQHVEWVNGEVVPMAPVTDEHSLTVGFLLTLLSQFCEVDELGTVLFAPFQMKLGPKLPSRVPDILFVSKKNARGLKKLYVDGPADLVVEVISPGSRGVDRGDKFYEYEQGGVREYWLIDPERKQAEFYHRGRDGIYRPSTVPDDGVYRSVVLKGLSLKVDWLWQRPLPPLLSILKAWGII